MVACRRPTSTILPAIPPCSYNSRRAIAPAQLYPCSNSCIHCAVPPAVPPCSYNCCRAVYPHLKRAGGGKVRQAAEGLGWRLQRIAPESSSAGGNIVTVTSAWSQLHAQPSRMAPLSGWHCSHPPSGHHHVLHRRHPRLWGTGKWTLAASFESEWTRSGMQHLPAQAVKFHAGACTRTRVCCQALCTVYVRRACAASSACVAPNHQPALPVRHTGGLLRVQGRAAAAVQVAGGGVGQGQVRGGRQVGRLIACLQESKAALLRRMDGAAVQPGMPTGCCTLKRTACPSGPCSKQCCGAFMLGSSC